MARITRSMRVRFAALVGVAGLAAFGLSMPSPALAASQAAAASQGSSASLDQHATINCANPDASALAIQCPDIDNPEQVFGHYVGHDEPGVWDYSSVPGSGNRAKWLLHLPVDPPPNATPGAASYSFEQHVAFWFGMDLCASQSYPEQVPGCTADTDANILDPKVSPAHVGEAYLELQFYPPGYTLMPFGISCSPTAWCAAAVLWSYYRNPVTGQNLNTACQQQIGGVETPNDAFITLDGKPTGPPDPLHSTLASFTPNSDVLFMNQGDAVGVTVEDSPAGLHIVLADQTSHQTGTMTASVANGFAQVNYAPDPSTQCTTTPYAFHPMYSTSSIQTRTTWTAFPYNVAWSDETGHFQVCDQVTNGNCTGQEGLPGNQSPADEDDNGCTTASQSSLDPVTGCIGENDGFDGTPYVDDWPNGSPNRPSPIEFSGPLTGPDFTINYQRTALVAPMPFNEHNQPCDTLTGTGCTNPPLTDTGTPAAFYPYFWTTNQNGCTWGEGTDVPGVTVQDFGKLAQYGSTADQNVWYTQTGGGAHQRFDVYMKTYQTNLCRETPTQVNG